MHINLSKSFPKKEIPPKSLKNVFVRDIYITLGFLHYTKVFLDDVTFLPFSPNMHVKWIRLECQQFPHVQLSSFAFRLDITMLIDLWR